MFAFCSGMAFGVAKKNFDEIDRAGFGGFVKKVRTVTLFAVSDIEVAMIQQKVVLNLEAS